ncbi:hypothetical protein [Mesorhizobium sp. J428]|uniref:hypothetical protein n=1 Tax=Mesorhizobium sp. J428 TaxID=2898440 RepID=UPI002151202A|nr:hypothetical protein [Mesorhizobium sp. J428]MCR5859725.1 hypothetical protein [Mesorhizobium sp. J428]
MSTLHAKGALHAKIKAQGASVTWRTVGIPEWGDEVKEGGKSVIKPLVVKVKTLNLDEYATWTKVLQEDGTTTERIQLIQQRTYDETGSTLLFPPDDLDAFSLLRNDADPIIISRLILAITRYSDRATATKN